MVICSLENEWRCELWLSRRDFVGEGRGKDGDVNRRLICSKVVLVWQMVWL